MPCDRTQVPHILVCDDDAAHREALALLLRARGYRVTEVGDGAQALRAIEACRPHLLITDLDMPGIDGEELCRRVRSIDGAPVPVIALSGRSPDRAPGRRAGFAAALGKPLVPEELHRALARCLRLRSRE